jgi:predicted nucleic acid-binding protein
MSPDRAADATSDLAALAVTRYGHMPLLERVWELRMSLSAYDAAYVALAEVLEAPLVTTDAALARAPGIRARIEVYR